jgi:hypothetical protein
MLFACAVSLSLILAMGIFVAWLAEAYVTWPHPDRSAWFVRQLTVGFELDGVFGRIPFALWLPVLLLLPLYAEFKRSRRERRPATLCPRCGYDLRASNDRCPECGAHFERCQPVPEPLPPRAVPWTRHRAAALWRRQHRKST